MGRASFLFRALFFGTFLSLAGCATSLTDVTAQSTAGPVQLQDTAGQPVTVAPAGVSASNAAKTDGLAMALGMYFF